mmetsp:Transcript_92996/g.250978  ORF Transcript_92996/g.250978 Transcript_92996/m.250978 type:complete len:450 (+) Transcript_92996:68-1417(+)
MASRRNSAWKRFLASPKAQRVAVTAGKVAAGCAAAGCGLALGLRELKRSQKPVDMWSEVTFDLRNRADRRGLEQGGPSKQLCSLGGFSADEFWAAARRLRPVELQLQELEEETRGGASGSSGEALVERWRAAGYFMKEPSRAELFGRRLTSDGQGVDIGVLVPPYLTSEVGVPAVQPPNWEPRPQLREEASQAVQRWGCALLRGAIAPEDVTALRESLGLGNGMGARRATEVGQWLLQRDPNVGMGRYTFGRLHCLLRGSPELEPHAMAVHAALAPLVHSFFRKEEAAGRRVFLSEAQLIVADPCAEGQGWHLENAGGPGLTVFLPLSNIAADRGPQSVLPGTHHLSDGSLGLRERLRLCLKALCATHGAVASAAAPDRTWAAGDALVLDGRLLHRGLPNDSLGSPAAVLVLRYDLTASPPPGCTRGWLRMMTHTGSLLQALFGLYAMV